MPLQTPAPPGGWMATPAPRKSILKVRFDPQPNTLTASSQEDTSAPQSQNGHPVRSPLTPPAEADEQVAKSKDHSDITHRGPDSSKGLKRLPSIRMLDAYAEDVANISSIKILNAMGREIEDQGDLSVMSTDDSTILDHNEALTRVRLGLNDLAHDMSDIDRSHDQIALDQTRLKELDTMSQAARETREKLSQTLRMARNSQEELRNKIAPLRASMRRSQLFVSPTKFGPTCVSLNRAKDIFMSTYYDPFEPDLHLYAIRPGTYDLLSSPHTWSILAIKDFVYRRGLKSAFAELWMICLDTLATWQKRTWRPARIFKPILLPTATYEGGIRRRASTVATGTVHINTLCLLSVATRTDPDLRQHHPKAGVRSSRVSDAIRNRIYVSLTQHCSYADFQISDGVTGDAEALAKAVFVDPFEGVDLATVSDQTQNDVETMRKAAEAAETGQFNPAIDAADGAEALTSFSAADALQNGKIKNKVLKLTGSVQVLNIKIAKAAAKGDDTSDLETKLQTQLGKLNKNIATDVAAAGEASKGVV
ncbi:small secreted protein [Salix suchowensis]|nr:small secreted protein [Salix suchowensis]